MRSFVYCVQDLTTDFLKIGKSNDINKRISELRVGNGSVLRVLSFARFPSETDALNFEKSLHKKYSDHKAPARNEWYLPEITKEVMIDLECAEYGNNIGFSRYNVCHRALLEREVLTCLSKHNGQMEIGLLNEEMYKLGASKSTLRRAKEDLINAKRIKVHTTGGKDTKKWFITIANNEWRNKQ